MKLQPCPISLRALSLSRLFSRPPPNVYAFLYWPPKDLANFKLLFNYRCHHSLLIEIDGKESIYFIIFFHTHTHLVIQLTKVCRTWGRLSKKWRRRATERFRPISMGCRPGVKRARGSQCALELHNGLLSDSLKMSLENDGRCLYDELDNSLGPWARVVLGLFFSVSLFP